MACLSVSTLELRERWHLPTRRLGRHVLVYDSVGSTNDAALSEELGTAVLADEQTAGRGRLGRAWICPPRTAIQLSLTLDPPLSTEDAAWAEALRKFAKTNLKNDQ